MLINRLLSASVICLVSGTVFGVPLSSAQESVPPLPSQNSKHLYFWEMNEEEPGSISQAGAAGAHENFKRRTEARISALNKEIRDLLLEPLPDENAVLARQNEINHLRAELSNKALEESITSRTASPENQVKDNLFGSPDAMFKGVKLSGDQETNMRELLKQRGETLAALNKRLNELQFDKNTLLTNANPDEDAILAQQAEINVVTDQIATEEVKSTLALRKVLTPAQRLQLFTCLHNRATFQVTGADQEQMKAIRACHHKIEQIDVESRKQIIDLEHELKLKLLQFPLDKSAVQLCEDKLNKVKADAVNAEISLIWEIRHILTPEQRTKLIELIKARPEEERKALPCPPRTNGQ